MYPKINSWVYSFSTHNSIEFEFTIVTVANLRICSLLKRHKRSACATWFKRKVLNQGLEVHIKLFKIISYKKDWDWKDLISYYERRYHKTIKPVFRRVECDIPKHCIGLKLIT